jgi:hypothetical protein
MTLNTGVPRRPRWPTRSHETSTLFVNCLAVCHCVSAIRGGSPQSRDEDSGIVRLRYATIIVRDYDEALRW